MLTKPRRGLRFCDNCKDFDRFADNVIEHSYLIHSEPELWLAQTPELFDPAPAHLASSLFSEDQTAILAKILTGIGQPPRIKRVKAVHAIAKNTGAPFLTS
jgi:hypothetical protein